MFRGVRPDGNAIRDSRERQGISLRRLGQRTHINYVTLWRVEKGLASLTEDEIQRLAGALGEPGEEITHDDPQEKGNDHDGSL